MKTEKRCTHCGKIKPIAEFGIQNNTPDGRRYHCKACHRLRRQNRQLSDPLYSKRKSIWSKYRIRYDQYEELLLKQGGKCPICGSDGTDCGKGTLVVDHDHENGGVRGLLCDRCNTGIGLLKEDEQIFLRAIEYLKR